VTRYRVGSAHEVPEGQALVMGAGERRLLVANLAGTYCAIDDVCTHDGGPLGEGTLLGGEVECPRHGGRFDICSGRATRMPAVRPVRSYAIEVQNGDLYVEIEDEW
jgi:3-phenylpropionate/trans-cinnamate dioxygenase ferredoxin component